MIERFVCFTLLFLTSNALKTSNPCKLKHIDSDKSYVGDVCICDSNYCDSLNVPEAKSNNKFLWVSSCAAGDRFSYTYQNISKSISKVKPNEIFDVFVTINRKKKYQKILGFGSSFTGSVLHNVRKLTPKMRDCLYKSYYSPKFGMGLSTMRLPIGGCDFDLEPWAYNEVPENDYKLSGFTRLDKREVERNTELDYLMKISNNSDIKLTATAWGPPPWMKEKCKWKGGKDNKLLPQYYQTWADYHLKWIDKMCKAGKRIWSISTGNEPLFAANLIFQALYWKPADQAKWVAENLGPTIKNSIHSNVEIHANDDQRHTALEYLAEFAKTNALDFISGLDFHAYIDEITSPKILKKIYKKYKKPIYCTEMSFGIPNTTLYPGPQLGMWSRAEKQCSIMIKNLNNRMSGYIDWNMILNSVGGPNNVDNYIDAPIILNKNYTKMFKQPMFYALAHFAKYIPRGSIRIDWKMDGLSSVWIQATAFLRSDRKITVILYNLDPEREIEVIIIDVKKGSLKINVKPQSINTIVYSTN